MNVKVNDIDMVISSKAIDLAAELAQNTLRCFGRADYQNSVKYYFDVRERLSRLNRAITYHSARETGSAAGNLAQLEVGSGTGFYTVMCNLLGIRTVGVEPSDGKYSLSLEISRELLRSNALDSNVIVEGDGERLPFADEQFDIVVSFQVLEHVQDLRQVLAEMKRVLKKNGIIYLEFPNYAFPVEQHYLHWFIPFMGAELNSRLFAFRGLPPQEMKTLNFLTPPVVRQLADRLGLVECRQMPEQEVFHLDTPQDFLDIDSKFGTSCFRPAFLTKAATALSGICGISPQVKICFTKES